MSRKILSYADLGPVTIVTTPIPVPSSLQARSPSREPALSEPPRKRMRTNEEDRGPPTVSNGTSQAGFHPNISHTNENGSRANGRKGKKPQRPGNPSGVPWTQHWDAQTFPGEERETALAYEDDASTSGTLKNQNLSHHDLVAKQTGWETTPPATFIGPMVPSSVKTEPAGGSAVTLPSPMKKPKGKNGRDKGLEKGAVFSIAQEEEWDDSALIDAWNAAEEEYREMNGGKKWRCEPVKHSSLWHDEPYEDEPADTETSDDDAELQESEIVTGTVLEETYEMEGTDLGQANATSVSFSHGSGVPLAPPTPFGALPLPVGTTRSAIMEEAFRRAQEASYTAGYWTAVYQMHASQKDQPTPNASDAKVGGTELAGDAAEDDFEDEEGEDGALADDFVPTQREPVI